MVDPRGASSGTWRRFAPIILIESYLSITVLCFAFGPWPWPIRNAFTLYSYLVLVQTALLVGYLSKAEQPRATYIGNTSRTTLLKISVYLNLIWILPKAYMRIGISGFSVQAMLERVVAGALNPGQSYVDKLDMVGGGSNSLLYVYILFTPILWLAVPLGVTAWESLSVGMKAAIVCIVVADAATWVAIGTSKGIADNVAIIAVAVLARPRKAHVSLSGLKRALVVVCLISMLVFYFSYAQISRRLGGMSVYDAGAGISLNTDNVFIAGFPAPMQALAGYMSSYLCQGYYGLSLALDEPFQWSYGVGHSIIATGIVKKITGFDASGLTYPARVEHAGWNMYARWHSAYPWFASDLTFPGTLVLVLLLGRLLASVWYDAQSTDNPYAVPLFVMVMVMLFYFNANDQILSVSQTFLAFWVLLFLWLSTRSTTTRGSGWKP